MSYKKKIISVYDAISKVKDGDTIISGLGASEGRTFLSNLHRIYDKINNVTVTTCLPMTDCEYFSNPIYSEKFYMDSWFLTPATRKAWKNGNISFIPNHLHLAAYKRLFYRKPNIYVGSASMPDKHGYISLSLSNTYEKRMIDAADLVILEINPNFPRTFGDLNIHYSQIDYLIESNYNPPEIDDVAPNELDTKIGGFVADLINDGDCIQLGIGGIPNAVASALINKKNLGVHTEMFTSGMMKLAKAGVVNGSKKNIHKGQMVCAFAMGTKELYEYIDDNPSILVMDGNYVNDPYTISQNDNQVSINTTIEIDLTGQCASESIGTRQFSGTGGQADTVIGAQKSKGGRSFITLYSTAKIKDKQTGEVKVISKIVPTLNNGAIVSLSRNDVDYVVTEYGVASLRGSDIRERARRLIGIAHPDFREKLEKEAKEMMYI